MTASCGARKLSIGLICLTKDPPLQASMGLSSAGPGRHPICYLRPKYRAEFPWAPRSLPFAVRKDYASAPAPADRRNRMGNQAGLVFQQERDRGQPAHLSSPPQAYSWGAEDCYPYGRAGWLHSGYFRLQPTMDFSPRTDTHPTREKGTIIQLIFERLPSIAMAYNTSRTFCQVLFCGVT
jgi:hypothetical protein